MCVAIVQANLVPLKWMSFNAAWGAANDKKYGRDQGEWDAHSARYASHFDAFKEALGEDSPLPKHLDLLATNTAWGAANERAYGKSRSGSQVDFDQANINAAKVLEFAGSNELGEEIEKACRAAAWYAANKYSYGEGNGDTLSSLSAFDKHIKSIKQLAPSNWPVNDLEGALKYRALSVAAHRWADLKEAKKKKHADRDFHFGYGMEDSSKRDDWIKYHDHAADLKKELGPDQAELFRQFEGMVIEAAWGAACERTSGKHSNDAQVHWKKYFLHAGEAESLYKGAAKWSDVKDMIFNAAWGAANERAYGQKSKEAINAWASFQDAALKVTTHNNGGEL